MAKHKGTIQEVSEADLRRTLEQKSGAERRTEARIPAELEVEVPLANVEQLRRVYTSNISKGGLMFSLTPPASMPATLRLVLRLPDGQKVDFATEVRHVARRANGNDFDVGVQFVDIPKDTQKKLEQALAGGSAGAPATAGHKGRA